ncbi:hypothetical protein E2493_19200 [Sphingomonas parva]|uniref:PEGA domain-containing protein n=1 Tax=Sphingomonas parva TaxID=2555898 RepID=A0A4Y8ZP72_9SPHN|nr:hypothetical protein [Sphingomonas parva]TFI56639.1 hypothetical protein E2493_19200 [Sphingomonas parva]
MKGRILSAVLVASASPALAQQAPIVVIPEAAQQAVLRQGTEVRMETLVELNSKRSRVGDRVDLEVAEPVSLNGQIVIPAGTRGTGEITRRKGKGMWGKSGKLEFRPLYIRLGERQLRVSSPATTRDKGKAGTAGVVAAVAFLPVAGFFVTGTSARIPARTGITVQLDEDLPVVFAAPAAPAPYVVQAAAPTAAPVATASPATQPVSSGSGTSSPQN